MWCYECLYVNNNWAAPLVYSPTQDGRWWSSFFTVSLFICDACGRASDEKNSTPRVCELPAHGLFCFSPSVTHMNVYLCLSGVVFRCRHQMGKLLTGQTQQRWFYGTGGCCFMRQEDVVLCSYLKILFQICQIKVKLSFSEWSLWWCHSIEILMPD